MLMILVFSPSLAMAPLAEMNSGMHQLIFIYKIDILGGAKMLQTIAWPSTTVVHAAVCRLHFTRNSETKLLRWCACLLLPMLATCLRGECRR